MTTTTTTTTTNLSFPPSNRVRRGLIAVLAGAALVASTGFVANRVADGGSLSAASPSHESTLDLTLLNGAIHVFTAPDVPQAVSSPMPRLVINEPAWAACASGHADMCQSTHTWVHATPLQGIGDIFEGMRSAVTPLPSLVVNAASTSACETGYADACQFGHTWVDATPLPGMGDIVTGMVVGG
jgi:hypothetical protein